MQRSIKVETVVEDCEKERIQKFSRIVERRAELGTSIVIGTRLSVDAYQ